MILKKKIKNKKKYIVNKKIFFNYYVEKKFIAGIQLKGWEVKSIRKGKVQITNGYIIIKNGEAFLVNVVFQPLQNILINNLCNINRNQKLLLHKKEIFILSTYYNIKRYTLLPIQLFWVRSWCKVMIGIARGKNYRDKRIDEKNRLWKNEKKTIFQRILI